ncbi:MAG: tetratricopeptide repeat protein [Nostocales cyanobacterium]|nr:MAG: tetratricopeptide repeat protein [Nostocales cyanobacterium]
MNIDDAVKFAQSRIEKHTKKPLNDSHMAVLRGCLEGKYYQDIAKDSGFSHNYVKEIGSKLWLILGEELGTNVTQRNFRSVIKQHLSTEKEKISNSKISPKCEESHNFVGRKTAINDINNLINEHYKIIVIQAAGGVGKTTLAKQYLYNNFDLVLPLEMAKDRENITSVESEIETWLKQYFQEEPGRDFKPTLNRLKQQLQKRKVGILIDNLEPALDKQGRLIEKHSLYVELLRVLGDENVQSLTLITSRERLCDDRIDCSIYHYTLPVLTVEAWKEFFITRKIKIDTPYLEAMHKIYGGNAKAMNILFGVMREDYDGDMVGYWLENSTCVETELKNLVESQFNRLESLDTDAYKLLCRLGCFRYQDVPRVSIDALLALLWDVAKDKRISIIKYLKNRCLVEFDKGEYWLHPIIREEGIERLKITGKWEEVNRKAAEFWTESVQTIENIDDAKTALEAYYHYVEISDFEMAAHVIVKERNSKWQNRSECLGRSFYRLGLLNQMILIINSIKEKVSCYTYSMKIYNLLGDLYWLTGSLNKAIKCHYESGEIATKLNIGDYVLRASFNTGLCYLELGEIESALQYFDKSYSDIDAIKMTIIVPELYYSHECACICYLAFLNSYLGLNKIAYYFVKKFYDYDSSTIDDLTVWVRGYSLLYIGKTYKVLGDLENAFLMYTQVISYAEETHYPQVKGKALTGLAELYRIQDDFETALFHHLESIEILEKISAKSDLSEAYYQLGLTYQKMGETKNSNTYFNKAIQLFQEMEAPKQVERVEKAKNQN